MFWKRKTRLTLRGKVLAILLPSMLAIIGIELWLTRVDAIDAANGAFDRSLLGAIKSVELGVSTASGGLAVELPYRLFEFFQLTARGNVYFRIATADGLVEIGSPDLPQPGVPVLVGVPVFYDAHYLGEPVRVGSYVRPLDRQLTPGGVQQLVIQIAESVDSRRAFTRSFVLRTAQRDAIVLSLVAVTLVMLMTLLLRPISRLAAQVTSRKPSDLQPLDERDLPRDIQPLVDAVNQQLHRSRELVERQRHFIDDASHQLRTALATLHAQVGYAIRQQASNELAMTLASIGQQVEHATRTTNQLLAHARADTVVLSQQRFNLGGLVREIGTRLLPLARTKNLDFGIDIHPETCLCDGDRPLLMEAIVNLAHNAISYAPSGGYVTLSVEEDQAGFSVKVINDGLPIPEHVIAHMGERFVKGQDSNGAGLGLAIVMSIIQRHAGWLRLERVEGMPRNCAWLWWPRADAGA